MAVNYFNPIDDQLYVQEEATYGTSPGAVAGGDAFKHTSGLMGVSYEKAVYLRDHDRGDGSPSVSQMQTGRSKSGIAIECEVIPSGVAASPTAPDADSLLKAGFGAKLLGTAHTTLAAASTATVLKFTPGGGVASGVAVGQLIAVDVSAVFGIEVRQVITVATDDITLDRALSGAPASGRSVYLGTTYRVNPAMLSLYIWLFNQNTLRYALPGTIIKEIDFATQFNQDVPILQGKFNGESMPEISQASTKPTPSTAGIPLTPDQGKIWLGTALHRVISAGFNLKNGLALRSSESDSLVPTGMKRTDNGSRYMVEQTLEMLLTTGTRDAQALYDAAKAFTPYDAIVQLGDAVGNIVAWRTPNWVPRGERTEQDGDAGLRLTGRALATSALNDEISLAFL